MHSDFISDCTTLWSDYFFITLTKCTTEQSCLEIKGQDKTEMNINAL